MKNRITPDNIIELNQNEIFVFGSNLIGVHGAGAAKKAMEFGAELGNPIGRQGNTYAIPTKDAFIKKSLSVKEIGYYVDNLINYAELNPELTFLVTEIGCGLAGYDPTDIAVLFSKAISVKNIHLPKRFWDCLKNHTNKFEPERFIKYLDEKFSKSTDVKENINVSLDFAISLIKNLDGTDEEKINKLLEIKEKLINFDLDKK
jgi:hypothetical protein